MTLNSLDPPGVMEEGVSGVRGDEVIEGDGNVEGGGKLGMTGPPPLLTPPPLGPGKGGKPSVTGGREEWWDGVSDCVNLSIGDQ